MGSPELQPGDVGGMVVILKAKLLAVLTVALLLLSCDDNKRLLSNGKPPPEFELAKLESGSLHFPDDLKDKIISVHFWADWCRFCKPEMRGIEPVYRKYRDEGLVILAINVRQDRKTARAFLNDIDITYDVLLDVDGDVADDYGVSGLPATYFIDRKGNLYTRILGESTPEVFETIVKELL